jgi:DNA-binding NarL/FixJ family response regulator
MFDDNLSLIIESDARSGKAAKDAIISLSDEEVKIVTKLKDARNTIEITRVLFMVLDLDIGIDEAIQFIQDLRKNSDNTNYKSPIIAISVNENYLKKAKNSGANAILLKPFGTTAIKELIIKIINNPLNFIMSRNYVGPDRRSRNEKTLKDKRNLRPKKE